MNRVYICTAGGVVIINELAEECAQCLSESSEKVKRCPIDGKTARNGKLENNKGLVFCCSKKSGFVASKAQFQKFYQATLPALDELESLKKKVEGNYSVNFRRMVHNLESHDAHILQEIGDLVPEQDLMRLGKKNIESLEKSVRTKPRETALAILTMLQNAIAIKHEITIYRQIISGGVNIKRGKHELHRVFINSAYKFFQDFSQKNIMLELGESSLYVFVDFDSISVALHHLLENAKKYCRPNSKLNITFREESGYAHLIFEMLSLKITKHDLENIFKSDYSGEHARNAGLNGSGYGMNVVEYLLKLNQSKISIDPNYTRASASMYNNSEYEENRIVIKLPLYDANKRR